MAASPTPVRTRLGFARACRIKQGRDFSRLRLQGRRLAHGCLILNWLATGAVRGRLGVVVSRKVGPAVVRSRARRLLREVWRKHQHGFPLPLDLVLVARPSLARKALAEVE